MTPTEDTLDAFMAAFGRHCSLVAEALRRGGDIDRIKQRPDVKAARWQVNEALARCGGKAALRLPKVVGRAREVKHAVEQEWNVRIPITTEASE